MIQFKHASRILAPVLVALCGLSATSAMAADLQPSQVPAQVRAVVEKMYPKAAFIEWEFDKEDGYYEAEFRNAGQDVDLKITPEGQMLYAKEDKSARDVPEAVRTAVLAKHPGARILDAEYIRRGTEQWWEVDLQLSSGEYIDVYSSPDGKSLN